MTLQVADIRANLNENIRHAARIIGKSKARLKVFKAVYRGQKQLKSLQELMALTGMSQVRVLQEVAKLAGNGIVDKIRKDGRYVYKKDKTLTHHKRAILDLVEDPSKKRKYPTKQEPRTSGSSTTYRITVRGTQSQPVPITVDEIEGFSRVRSIKTPTVDLRVNRIPERRIKTFLRKVIGESHDFVDWGGEKSDLYTNKLLFRGSRRTAAFALKGRATQGELTPKKMGKNGDQIGRLLGSEADFFLVVYHSKVAESIHEQLRAFAIGRSLGGRRTYYGVVDGQDLHRLIQAYKKEFDESA